MRGASTLLPPHPADTSSQFRCEVRWYSTGLIPRRLSIAIAALLLVGAGASCGSQDTTEQVDRYCAVARDKGISPDLVPVAPPSLQDEIDVIFDGNLDRTLADNDLLFNAAFQTVEDFNEEHCELG